MPNILPSLNEHIRKQARRDLKPLLADAKRRTAEHRRSIAALKREVVLLRREIAALKKHLPAAPAKEVQGEVLQKSRLRIDGLKTHRHKLGLSAKDYGRLLGVSALTVYNWEAGKSRPRRSQLPRIISVRGIGKREAAERLKAA
ncbi:MAG: helix-turn-helix domain-containing protein [Phycisphaerae bacterium]